MALRRISTIGKRYDEALAKYARAFRVVSNHRQTCKICKAAVEDWLKRRGALGIYEESLYRCAQGQKQVERAMKLNEIRWSLIDDAE